MVGHPRGQPRAVVLAYMIVYKDFDENYNVSEKYLFSCINPTIWAYKMVNLPYFLIWTFLCLQKAHVWTSYYCWNLLGSPRAQRTRAWSHPWPRWPVWSLAQSRTRWDDLTGHPLPILQIFYFWKLSKLYENCVEADNMPPIMMAMFRPFILGLYCETARGPRDYI